MALFKKIIFWFEGFIAFTLLFIGSVLFGKQLLALSYLKVKLSGLLSNVITIAIDTVSQLLDNPEVAKLFLYFAIGYIVYVISLFYFAQTDTQQRKIKYIIFSSSLGLIFIFLGVVLSSMISSIISN